MKQKISFLYKLLIVVVSGIGLYLNFRFIPFKINILYFTIQSNLLCFVFYFVIILLELFNKLKKNNLYYILKGMVTMSITITMFIYQGLLASTLSTTIYSGHLLESNFLHLIVPLMVMIDYAVFGEKGHLKKKYPFYWSIILIIYFIFNVIYIGIGGKFAGGASYPYYYMDVTKYGYLGV